MDAIEQIIRQVLPAAKVFGISEYRACKEAVEGEGLQWLPEHDQLLYDISSELEGQFDGA